ncbi:permease [Oceanibacterium hippocampi]|uniref:Putative permease n=1 Tax=Oceanibacterium hippocampi TaxID=745714 RepID=A0A1Y5RD93_9PROT|nr:permease [Oceanibacterium hippocampi]SLN12023.1 putative permease [Oceanibacterium hippocampi]
MTQLESTLRSVARLALPVDRVAAAFLAAVALLAVSVPDQAVESLEFTALSLLRIAPFIALSVLIAAAATASGADGVIARAFEGKPLQVIVAGALVGALSPFCGCGVIPLIAALLAAGVPLPGVMAFWLASPIIDPEMFVLTAAGLGLEFAVVKTVAAIAIGLVGGFTILALNRAGYLFEPMKPGAAGSGCGGPKLAARPHWRFWDMEERRRKFAVSAREAGWFLGKWLALAFLVESLMVAWAPADAIAGWFGSGEGAAIPLAALIGIPAYLNGYAAIPTVSGLMELGMGKGAGLAFMLAGSITSIPAAIAVWALARRAVFFWYLALAYVTAVGAGEAYRLFGQLSG